MTVIIHVVTQPSAYMSCIYMYINMYINMHMCIGTIREPWHYGTQHIVHTLYTCTCIYLNNIPVHAHKHTVPGADPGFREGGCWPLNRGWVREGDVPPPARSAEAFELSAILCVCTYVHAL